MPVTFDAVGPSSSGYVNTSPTAVSGSYNWSHTIGASATALVAWVTFDSVTNGTCTCTVSSTSMTAYASNPILNEASGSGQCFAFYLPNPPTGSGLTVAFSYSGMTNGSMDCITGGSMSFTGAGGFGTPATVISHSGTSLILTVTGVASTSMVAGFGGFGDSPVGTTVTGTSRFEADGLGSGGNSTANSAGATNTGTGSVTVGWSGLPSGDTNCGWAVEVQAAPVTGVPVIPPPGLASRPAVVPFFAGRTGAQHSQ